MNRLLQTYRAVHQQSLMPIFVADDFDSKTLVEGCVAAGLKCIEYTLRRSDAKTMIPWIRRHYPDLILLVGSTLDDDTIVAQRRERYPQLMTIDEIAQIGVDGFVSMVGWRRETIEKYAPTHLVAPTSGTLSEALQSVGAGAHFVKMAGDDLSLVRRCRGAAAFDFCPVFVTGGMTVERIPYAFDAGAVVVGAGFDLMMKDYGADASASDVAAALRPYLQAAHNARAEFWPEIEDEAEDQQWLASLPHYHGF